jgi:uncharacterized membrane protein YvlD (DUF360 family)
MVWVVPVVSVSRECCVLKASVVQCPVAQVRSADLTELVAIVAMEMQQLMVALIIKSVMKPLSFVCMGRLVTVVASSAALTDTEDHAEHVRAMIATSMPLNALTESVYQVIVNAVAFSSASTLVLRGI